MKRTEQWPTQPLTEHISVTNIEQTRPQLADEPTEKLAMEMGEKTRIF